MAPKILVIQTAFLGDLLLSIPLLKNTRRLFPNAKIILLCRKGFGEFFEKLELVDSTVEVDKSNADSARNAQKIIKSHDYELVLCPHQSLRSAIWAKSVKSKMTIGFKTWWNTIFFNFRVERPMGLPDALRQLALLKILDKKIEAFFNDSQIDSRFLSVDADIPDWSSMQASVKIDDKIQQKYQVSGKTAYLAPGSVWNTKRWIKDNYISLGKRLNDDGYQVVVVGSPEEHEYAEDIARQIPNAKNIAGQPSLYELVQLLSFGKILVTNDNGAMHLGSVAGISTVAIFGPTTLSLGYRPWSQTARVVEDVNLKCRPCGKHGHKVCPIGTHDCMKNVSVEMVYSAIKTLSL